ncbi:unnamed protein product [Chironomus riparius]|uniref:KaiC-like domain-containing protein n=1 Tax=Chironomus riparius TaxID=315576 RepID=A0A9N9S140_9DIPT|nr:unnamed protein product [Chironomus riparius]
MPQNKKFLPKRKKSSKSKKDNVKFHRTDYSSEIFGDFSVEDLKFLHKVPIKLQIKKLKELLRYDNKIDDDTMPNILPDADSLHVEDTIKTEIISSGIKEFDDLFVAKGILSGTIMEICGKRNVGKSILINSILINILKDHTDFEVIYFDSKPQFRTDIITKLCAAQGMNDKDAENINKRFSIIQINNMYDLVHALEQLFDPQRVCRIYNKNFDMSKVRFIVINTITMPYYHCSSPLSVSKKITSDLHKTIHRLAKYYGVTFFIANITLHRLNKTSESDKGDDASSTSSVLSLLEPAEKFKAALDEFWPEILDYRFYMTESSGCFDSLGFLKLPRNLELVEGRYEKIGETAEVYITELGMV